MIKTIAVIEGDDAAPEAMRPVVALVDSLNIGLEWVYPEVGEAAEAKTGSIFPDEAKALRKDHRRRNHGTGQRAHADLIDARDDGDPVGSQLTFVTKHASQARRVRSGRRRRDGGDHHHRR